MLLHLCDTWYQISIIHSLIHEYHVCEIYDFVSAWYMISCLLDRLYQFSKIYWITSLWYIKSHLHDIITTLSACVSVVLLILNHEALHLHTPFVTLQVLPLIPPWKTGTCNFSFFQSPYWALLNKCYSSFTIFNQIKPFWIIFHHF